MPNKYDVKVCLEGYLSEFKSTFEKTSLDTAKQEYLCQDSLHSVYNFDAYVKASFPNNNLPSSPDAIYVGIKKVYFVEFKNSRPEDIDNKSIRDKFNRGTEVLQGLLKDFTPKDVRFIFCVVYRSSKSTSKNDSPLYFNSSLVEKNIVKFGLEEENSKFNNFYSHILTNDVDFYKETFKNLTC